MGEYFKLSNVTKRQNIHPHQVGEGLKFSEWVYMSSNVIKCALELFARGAWESGDEIRIVSDYGTSIHLLGPDSGAKSTYDEESFVDVHFDSTGNHGRHWTLTPELEKESEHDPSILTANIARVRADRGLDEG